MKVIITNAFSLQMLCEANNVVSICKLAVPARDYLRDKEIISGVGHSDTAALFSAECGVNIPHNRINVSLKNENLLVGQIVGGRLPEGTTTLPDGVKLVWWLVKRMEG